jgi:hypothetical protein
MQGRYHEITARHAEFSWTIGWVRTGELQRAQKLGPALHLVENRASGQRGSSGHWPLSQSADCRLAGRPRATPDAASGCAV